MHYRKKLHRLVCVLLSRILSILGKTAFCKDTTTFANTLRQGLLQLPKDSKRWNDAVAHRGEDGTALMVLLYYHFQGTREYEITYWFLFFYHSRLIRTLIRV
jgi:hypothetical protein